MSIATYIVTPERRALLGQLIRYGVTGGLASIVNFAVYWIAAMHTNPLAAWTIGFLAAVIVGYAVHSRWSFKGHGRRDNLARSGVRFFIVSLVSFALNLFWVWLLVQHFGLPKWSHFPLVLGVTPLAVFALNRQWVFN